MDTRFQWYNPVKGARVETVIPEATWRDMQAEYETNKASYVARGCTDFETYVIMVLWMDASR